MSSFGIILCASLLSSALALALGWRCLRGTRKGERHRGSSWLGLLISVCGVVLSLGTLFSRITPSLPPPSRDVALFPPSVASGGVSFTRLARPLLGPVRPGLSLLVEGLDLDALLEKAVKEERWFLLDGSDGIRPEYRSWVEKRFGKLEEVPIGADGKRPLSSLCFRRSELFPLASGRCVSRPVSFTLAQSPLDLGRVESGRAAVTVRRQKEAVLALTLEGAPAAPSIEEGCLDALADQTACAALEALPAATLSSVVLHASEGSQLRVFREFDVPTPKEQDEALSIYGDGSRLEVSVDAHYAEHRVCGGMTGPNQVRAIKLTTLDSQLANARSEEEATSALDELDKIEDCPAIALIEIPTLHIHNEVSAFRSILTQIRERPLWVTTLESLKYRFQTIDRTQIAWAAKDGSLWIRPPARPTKLRNLAVTILSQHPVTDNDLEVASRSDPTVELTIHRLTPSSLRLSFSELDGDLGVKISRRISEGPSRSSQTFLDWTGFAGTAVLAFILAAATALFQSLTLSPRTTRPFFVGTFSAVFLIVFVWAFVSYRTALAPTGILASVASVERPPAPIHYFLRDWPDADPATLLALDKSGDLWTKWADYLANARKELSKRLRTKPGRMWIVSNASVPRSVLPAAGRIVLWDDARARNFHFRADADYRATVLGWKSLLQKTHADFSLESGGSLARTLLRSPQFLVIPDIRFLSAEEQEKLHEWVQSGGTLIAAEGTPAAGIPDMTAAGWLAPAGFGAETQRSYSRIQLTGSRVLEINTPHLAINTPQGELPYGAAQVGHGRAFFLGVTPVSRSGRDFVSQWLAGVMGARISVPTGNADCSSTLLLQPWGAPAEQIRLFAFGLRSRGISFQWLVDPVSFAQMMPQWQDDFRRDGVVFSDDGTRATRELGALLAADAGWTDTSALIFASGRNPARYGKTAPGPDGATLLSYVPFPGSDAPDMAAQRWRSECFTGPADARLVDSGWIAQGASPAQLLSGTGFSRQQLVAPTQSIRIFRQILAPGTHTIRVLVPDPLDPFTFRPEDTGAAAEVRK